jgi:hypothetical protein
MSTEAHNFSIVGTLVSRGKLHASNETITMSRRLAQDGFVYRLYQGSQF